MDEGFGQLIVPLDQRWQIYAQHLDLVHWQELLLQLAQVPMYQPTDDFCFPCPF
jgi:hypothetical protein